MHVLSQERQSYSEVWRWEHPDIGLVLCKQYWAVAHH